MADWQVIADKIEIFPHPNADKMELGRVGPFQVVVGKGLYVSGDIVVFAPKRSVLPSDLRPYFVNEETGRTYLKGPNEDRVGSIRLRGEESEGVILPKEWVQSGWKTSIPMGVDLSEALDIKEYTPETQSVGKAHSFDYGVVMPRPASLQFWRKHDVDNFGIYQSEFVLGEPVIVTEKIHGSQISIAKSRDGVVSVSSKGRAEKNLVLRPYPRKELWKGRNFWKKLKNFFRVVFSQNKAALNEYWRYFTDSDVNEFLTRADLEGKEVQVFGEVVPLQKGFSYGFEKPKILVFKVIIEGVEQQYGYGEMYLNWAPLLYAGAYNIDTIKALAEGKETVSGKSLHIREGLVLTPASFRRNHYGGPLICKILNSKYKENDDEIR